jgi:hypothetical protein
LVSCLLIRSKYLLTPEHPADPSTGVLTPCTERHRNAEA